MFGRKDIQEKDDRQLTEAYRQSGQQEIIGELYRRYGHLVYGVCLKYLKNQPEAQDAVVNIFEKLIKDLRINDVQHFKSWLHTVTRNHCLMFLRKHNKIRNREADIEVVEPYLEYEEDNSKVETELKLEQLEAAIPKLKPEQRKCVELFYLQGKCYQEVADETGYTMKQVKSYLQNGKRNLKNLLVTSNVS